MEIETLFSTPPSSSDGVLKNTRLIPELYATGGYFGFHWLPQQSWLPITVQVTSV